MTCCPANHLIDDVTRLLDAVLNYEQIARDYRKEAGRILAQAKINDPDGNWQGQFDSRTADLLVTMAMGRQ